MYHAYFEILSKQALDGDSKKMFRQMALNCMMHKNEAKNYPDEETVRRIVYAIYEPIFQEKIQYILNHTDLTPLQQQTVENLWDSIKKILHFKTIKIFTFTEIVFDSAIQVYFDSL